MSVRKGNKKVDDSDFQAVLQKARQQEIVGESIDPY